MLRFLILVVLVINIAFYGWTQGWFGEKPGMENREPQRITNQVRPEALRTAPSSAPNASNITFPASAPAAATQTASAVPAPAPATVTPPRTDLVCIETGPLSGTQSSQLQQLVSTALPDEMWEMSVQTEPSSWAVYIGPFESEDEAQNKKAELAGLGVVSEIIRNRPQYQPGLTLGLFRERSNADRLMSTILEKNVTEARIVPWTLNPIGQLLRIAQATPEQRTQLDQLAAQATAPAFRLCETPHP